MENSVTKADICRALSELKIETGDIVVVHSSLKSMGYVEGGAETVIEALLMSVSNSGTVVMPTFTQKDFINAYETWHIDKPSDTGYITEIFRKYPGSIRSDQATHSVTANGRQATYITENHTAYGRRFGVFGDTPFCVSSPWQKLYDMNAKVVFIGVSMKYNTSKHLMEYILVEKALNGIKSDSDRLKMKSMLRDHRHFDDKRFLWPFLNGEQHQELCQKNGLVLHAQCGSAQFLCCKIKDTLDLLEKDVASNPEQWLSPEMISWFNECKALS